MKWDIKQAEPWWVHGRGHSQGGCWTATRQISYAFVLRYEKVACGDTGHVGQQDQCAEQSVSALCPCWKCCLTRWWRLQPFSWGMAPCSLLRRSCPSALRTVFQCSASQAGTAEQRSLCFQEPLVHARYRPLISTPFLLCYPTYWPAVRFQFSTVAPSHKYQMYTEIYSFILLVLRG